MASFPYDEASTVVHTRDGINLMQHDSTIGTIVRLNAAFMAVIAVLISIRLYVRSRVVRQLGSDDVLMVFAALFTISLCAICILGTRFGLGRHERDLNPATVMDSSSKIVKTLFVCQVVYATAVTFTKASIIASYLRVLPTPSFWRLMYGTASLIVAMWICSIFVTIFQCDPVKGAWEFALREKKCLNILTFFYFSSSVNILTELVLCISPLPLFWRIQMSLKERIILCMLFGTGIFATAASAVRLNQLHNLGSLDVSYTCVSSLNWSVVEVGTGIICASVPSLKPLLTRGFPGKSSNLSTRSISWPSRNNHTVMQTAEGDSCVVETSSYGDSFFVEMGLYGDPSNVEMGSHEDSCIGDMISCQSASTDLQKAGSSQVSGSVGRKSMSTYDSGEETLISAGSHHELDIMITVNGKIQPEQRR